MLRHSARPPGSLKLQGASALYRLRSGDYRIIYGVMEDRTIVVTVVRIQHRKDVYDDL